MVVEMIQAIAALGTWAAVLVVLYIEVIRPRRRGPRLVLMSAGTSQTTVIPQPGSCEWAWHRLRVENVGSVSATEVEVIITSFDYDPGSLIAEPNLPLGSQQALLVGKNLKWASVESSVVAIPPQGARLLDVLIQFPKGRGPSRYSSGSALALFPTPEHSERDHVPASRWTVDLAISGRDVPPHEFRVAVTVDSSWDGVGGPLARFEVGGAGSQPRQRLSRGPQAGLAPR